MSQSKPSVATTHESNLSTLIASIQSVLSDATTLRWYSDRDMKPVAFTNFLASCQQFQALLTAAGNKGGL